MNAVFKVVYNEALKVFQVVNEMTRSRGKRASSGFGGQQIDFSVNISRFHFSGVAVVLMAAGIVGGMPASALAEDLEMNDSYTVDSDKTVDSITASITDKTLTINSPHTLTISQNGKDSLIASAIQGTGTLSLENVKLRVKDNANTSFDGTINLQGNTVVNVVHLTGLTGTMGTGTICVGDGSKLVGDGRGNSNSDIQVNARLSGGGSIELIEELGSKITLANDKNDFSGTFSLKNGTLTWASDVAVKFFSYEDTKTKLDDVTLDVTSDVTFKSLELTSSMIDLNEGATLQADSLTLTDSGYQNTIVGSGTINALLTGGANSQILRIGNVNEICNVNLSAEVEHTYIGNIIISPGATLDVAGSLRDPIYSTRTIEVRGTLNVRGKDNRSCGTITIISGGKATFEKNLTAWSLNVESGGALNLLGSQPGIFVTLTGEVSGKGRINIGKNVRLMIQSKKSETEALKIGNEFQGDGTLNIFRLTPGDVVFEGNSASSRIGTLNLTNSRVASSNAGAVLEKAQNTSIMSGSVLTIDSVQSVQNLKLESGGKLLFEGGTLSVKSGLDNQIASMDALSGSGTLSLDNQSALVISNAEKKTAFTGSFNLGQGTKLTFESDSDFELSLTVSGDGDIGIDANGGTFSIKSADRIKGLSGTLSLSNTKFTLDKKVEGKNLWAKDTELQVASKSSLGDLSLNDSKLIFAEEGAPGTIGPAGTHLSVQNLSFSGTNTIQLDNMFVAANPPEDSSKVGLTAQDVLSEDQNVRLKTVLITSTNPIQGAKAAGFTIVDKNGVSIESEKSVNVK